MQGAGSIGSGGGDNGFSLKRKSSGLKLHGFD